MVESETPPRMDPTVQELRVQLAGAMARIQALEAEAPELTTATLAKLIERPPLFEGTVNDRKTLAVKVFVDSVENYLEATAVKLNVHKIAVLTSLLQGDAKKEFMAQTQDSGKFATYDAATK